MDPSKKAEDHEVVGIFTIPVHFKETRAEQLTNYGVWDGNYGAIAVRICNNDWSMRTVAVAVRRVRAWALGF